MHIREQQFLKMIFGEPKLGRGLGNINLTDVLANSYYRVIQDPEVNDIFVAAEKMEVELNELIEYSDQFLMCGYREEDAQKLIDFVKSNSIVNSFIGEYHEGFKELQESKDKLSTVNQVLEKLINSVKSNSSNHQKTIGQALVDTVEHYESVLNGEIEKGLDFGIPEVDSLLDGARGGDLIVIAGRSGSGKTVAGLQWCINQMAKNKFGMFFSLEMQVRTLVTRMIANMAEVPLNHFKTGHGHTQGVAPDKLNYIMARQKNLMINDKGSKPITEICNDARIQNLKNPIDYIVIDYAQLITDDLSTNRNTIKTESIGRITKALKSLAKELDIPIILLAQVARAVDTRVLGGWMGKPTRADISDSKEIENDCDVLITLYAPFRYDKHKDDPSLQGKVMWGFVKHRDGEEGEAWVDFKGQYQRMYPLFEEFKPKPTGEEVRERPKF